MSGFLYVIYFAIVIAAGIKVLVDYSFRQLVKANFWCNVAILALVALSVLMQLSLFVGD